MKIEIGYTELGKKIHAVLKRDFDLFETVQAGEYEEAGSQFGFADDGNEYNILGVIQYKISDDVIIIEAVQVLPAAQKQGIGTAFIEALRAEFPGKPIRATNVTAKNALKWYKNRGFVKDRDSRWADDYVLLG